MSDQTENIVIAIQSLGVDKVVADLKQTGLTGQAAAQQVSQAMLGAANSTTNLSNKVIILTDAILNGEKNIADYTAELNQFTDAELAATAGAIKMAAAEADAAEAIALAQKAAASGATSLEEYNAKIAATTKSYSSFKSILTTVGGLLAVDEIKKASDEYTTLSNQLGQVTTSQSNFNDVLGKLTTTANQTQSDIGAVVKLYYNLAQSTRDLAPSQDDLLKATDAITQGLYANNVAGNASTRVLKDFSEVLSGAGNSSRLFNSIQQQAPGLLKDLATSLGVSTEALRQSGSTATTSTKAVKDYTSTIAGQKSANDNTAASIQNLQTKLASGTLTGNAYAQAATKLNDEQAKLSAGTQSYARDRADATDADAKAATALNNTKISAADLLRGLSDLDTKEKNLAATNSGTLGGALTVLNNNFVLFVGNVNKATGLSGLFRDAILGIANNLNIVIPLISAFIAAWAFSTTITAIKNIATAITGVTKALTGVETVFGLSVGGWAIILGVVLIAIGAILDKFGLLQPLLTALGNAFQTAWNWFAQGAQNALESAQSLFNWIKTNDFTVWFTTELTNMWDNWNNGVQAIENAWSSLVQTIEGGTLFQYFQSLIDLLTGVDSKERAVLNDAAAARNAVNSIGNVNFANAPQFRSGGALTVPGTGPTDSVPVSFMATPGETISIRTPAQSKAMGFRDGGDIAITGGLNGVDVTFVPSNDDSVTGYQTIALPTSSLPTSSGSSSGGSGSVAVQGNSIATTIADALSIYGNPPPLLYQRSIDALSYIRGDAQNSQFVSNNAASLLKQGISVTSVYTSDSAGAIRAGASFEVANDNAQSDYDQQALAYIQSIIESKGAAGGALEGWAALSGPLTTRGTTFGQTAQLSSDLSKGAIAWNQARFNYEKTANPQAFEQFGLQLGGVSGSAGLAGTASYSSSSTFSPDPITGEPDLVSSSFSIGARSGLDMIVPGAGPVDSRFLPLNVSPGEHVSVKTPAQQRSSVSAQGTRHVVINQTFHVKDMSDIRASDKQRNQANAAAISRAARRSGLG